MHDVHHVSVYIDRHPSDVYEFAADPKSLPRWAAGLARSDVAAGKKHTVARRSDDIVVAWGDNLYGQCNVPALPPGLRRVEVVAGEEHSAARFGDGSVLAWGNNSRGQSSVPALSPGLTFVHTSAGTFHTVAILGAGAYSTFGAGCPGSAGVTRLEPIVQPRVGASLVVRIQPLPLPLTVAMMITGFSCASSAGGPPPLDLSPLGLTNCWLRVSRTSPTR
ncbi:MAG TPA: hypothetical protein VF384_14245 [Planctomycetota bacterium]